MLTIIVPTYNEKHNVIIISEALAKVMGDIEYEILFMDDSRDETVEILKELSNQYPHIRYFHRDNERGLATAVVKGFELAKGDIVTVIDSDMQHPPILVPRMYKEIEAGYDIVIPSRFIPGGDDGGLNIKRKLISFVARYIGKVSLRSLRKISDATSGVFMFKKSIIEGKELNPIGWKILIEVLVKGEYKTVQEIPYKFQARAEDESKMSMKEQLNYLLHLLRIIKENPKEARFLKFALVGISGVFVNMIIYYMLVQGGIYVPFAGGLAACVAMCSNYILNETITWKEIKLNRSKTFLKFIMTSFVGIGISVVCIQILNVNLGVHYMLSNAMGIIAAMFWNYQINKRWTWEEKKEDIVIHVSNDEGY